MSKQGAKIRKMHELPYSSCIIFVVLFYNRNQVVILKWLPDYHWSGKRDSNSRPLAWKANALPTELLPHFCQFKGASFKLYCKGRYNFYISNKNPVFLIEKIIVLVSIPYLTATSFLGLTASRYFTDSEAPLLMIVFFSVELIFLSGVSYPIELMPWYW